MSELAAKIDRLEAENRQMRSDIAKMRNQGGPKADRSRADTQGKNPSAAYPVAQKPPATPLQPATLATVIPNGSSRGPSVHQNGTTTIGSITITPGGYLAAEGIFRTRTLQADIVTPFAAVPTLNQSFAHADEFRFTSRQTRASVLVEAALSPSTTLGAYTEIDFLGAAGTANNIESDSYNPRLRVLYGTLDSSDAGLHVLAGQNWTLATSNSKGILPRNLSLPSTIDEQFVAGFVWLRQPQLRITKDFNQKVWVALSAEEPQTTFGGGGGCTPGSGSTTIGSAADTGVAALTCQVVPQGSGGFNNTRTPYSLNQVPDVIGKVALDQTIAGREVHVEGLALYRDLFDRVTYTNGVSANQNRTGYGFGGSLVVPLIPRRLELQANGLMGTGIGRYGTSTLPDATFASDGSAKPIRESMVQAGLILHAAPSLDIYANAGFERQFSTYFSNGPGSFYGVGVPNANNSGCNIELSANCSTDTKETREITVGFWDNVYAGPLGTLKGGVQYGYVSRELFSSVFNGRYYAPKTNDNVIYTSLRYYPFSD